VKRIFEAVKTIPESLFAALERADEYLDQFIAMIDKDVNNKKGTGKS